MRAAQPPAVETVDSLNRLLPKIGGVKASSPFQLRGWINRLGLYVQLRGVPDRRNAEGGWYVLKAGGMFRSYFESKARDHQMSGWLANDPTILGMFAFEADKAAWKTVKLDLATWTRRFAGLVWPTLEIAAFVRSRWFEDVPLPDEEGVWARAFAGKHGQILEDAMARYRAEGSWPRLVDWTCMSCGDELAIWQMESEDPCPLCGRSTSEGRD